MTKRTLTDAEIEESIRFADAANAAAGHIVKSTESDEDIRSALRGDITFDEAIERAAARAGV
jgi:hypothetical protein